MCSSIPNKMVLQRKVAISLGENFKRVLPSDIDMEVSLVHESSFLDVQREDVREYLGDLFEKPIERFQIRHATILEIFIYEGGSQTSGLKDVK